MSITVPKNHSAIAAVGNVACTDIEDDDIEMHLLIADNDDLKQKSGAKKKSEEGLVQRLLLRIDERSNVKVLMRMWGPRLEFVVRLMLVATFLDDSLHTVAHFSEHTKQIKLVGVVAPIALGIGLLAQFFGVICLLMRFQSDYATIALICWMITQPVLYGQLSNFEFVAESLSVIGGLLMLRAHLVFKQTNHGCGKHTQLLGRLLLPTMYLYYAGLFFFSASSLDETSDLVVYVSSLSMFFVNTAMLLGLVICSTLIATGLKSRLVAFLLALVNLGFVFYQHPFFRYIWREDGEWKYDEDNMSMPGVALPTDISPSDVVFDPLQIYNLHRYYFFLGLSTSGALLLLAQFGPGEIAIQEDEILLPVVARAQD
ncbi:hypothetical protein FRACYDRAFT_252525 [Fragilariopsis cylindrus CCMP1102]|uniref:Uncharacterized protein n=1 Tax=Fragilariopsis cylindrus CCMP1102 TaxID=635003 RepID=A0A1E7ELY1_9STRA|nr:hypothetical protein FRACYDRAFT_252525 [Fragilariopsis cylindrus CCMP1102]|eukprot:OEU06895.1 hypothetical protein FRACYDRAFT_252525 [Fragilariopsis cylindrus CCMP1102]